ncbi:MAG: hypothetical protein NT016_02075 [Candidatus Aenigmarchaeota archaeon]|nr:hypothetical protein [Candidatus Aenigmarchaeota archaeon]
MPHYGLGGVRVVLSGDPGVRSWRWVGAPGEKLEVTLGDYGRDEQASLLEQCVKEALTLDFRYVEPPLRACKVPAIPNPMPI